VVIKNNGMHFLRIVLPLTVAVCAFSSAAFANIEQIFSLEAAFAKMVVTPKTVVGHYTDFNPGFGVGCNYLARFIPYLGVGGRLSYARFLESGYSENALNSMELSAIARPMYEFHTKIKLMAFAQAGGGVYKQIFQDIDTTHQVSHWGMNFGAGISIGTFDIGVIHNIAFDRSGAENPQWFSIFAALRMSV
jgi:hypothetical protein